MADGGEKRRTVSRRRTEKRRRSGGDSTAIDCRLSGDETSHHAKLVEGIGFDDIHSQSLREHWKS